MNFERKSDMLAWQWCRGDRDYEVMLSLEPGRWALPIGVEHGRLRGALWRLHLHTQHALAPHPVHGRPLHIRPNYSENHMKVTSENKSVRVLVEVKALDGSVSYEWREGAGYGDHA